MRKVRKEILSILKVIQTELVVRVLSESRCAKFKVCFAHLIYSWTKEKRIGRRPERKEHTHLHTDSVGATKAGRCLGLIWQLTLNPQGINETDLGGIANVVIIRAHSCEPSLPNRT